MSDEPDIETVASIDTVGAVAYARGAGEAIAAYYSSLIDGGLPEDLAAEILRSYVAAYYGTVESDCEDEVDEDEEP